MRLTTHCFLSSTNFHHVTADCIYISHDVDDDDESFIVMTPGNFISVRTSRLICWREEEYIGLTEIAGVDNDGVVDSKFKP